MSALTGRQLLLILLDMPDTDLDLTVFVDALGDQVIGGDAVAVFHEPEPGRIAIVSRSALTHHRNDPEAHRLEVDVRWLEPAAAHVPVAAEPEADLIGRIKTLAEEAWLKGKALQAVPELKLVGNAYVGMSERITQALAPQ